MKIDSSYVGKRSKSLSVALSPRRAMNYAAAVNDDNPHYFDDTRDGGIVAPPMLAVALTWPLSSRFDEYWGELDFPEEAQQRQVHYNETIAWKRPLRPDERLVIRGEIVAMVPHRGGTLITIRYDAVAGKNELVFTEYISGLLRDVVLADAGRRSDDVPGPWTKSEDSSGGWSKEIAVDPLAAHVYDGCTDIVFPIHTSNAFATLVGLPAPIYQGTAALAQAVREILNREAAGDPAALAAVHCGFRGMILPGARIDLRVQSVTETARERVVCFEVANDRGATALKNGRVHLHNTTK